MAFDYDEKEMNDSTNKKIDLDQYGVWVKKPPRNVEVTSIDQSNDTQDEIIQEENFNDIIPEMEEMELETNSLETSPIDDFESIAQEATSDLSALVEFEEQPIEDFFTDEERKAIENEDDEVPLETFIEADFLDDFSTTVIDEKEEKEDNLDTTVMMEDNTSTEESIMPKEINLVPDYEEESDDFNPFPDQFSENESIIDMELPNDFKEEKLSFVEETMPVMETFTDAEGNPVLSENNYSEDEKTEEEISIDDFLNDDEEISLDEFIDVPAEGKNDILDETPMEMSLTFDDEYVTETAPDPVNQVEESPAIEEVDDFDEMFDNIVDEGITQTEENIEEKEEKSVAAGEKTEIVFDEVNDFDDFLSEFAEPETTSKTFEAQKEYDLTVTMDEEGTVGSDITEINEDKESENISLISDALDEKNNKNEEPSIDRLQISDYTERSYSSDDFDVDKILSEVEDIGEKTEEVQVTVAQESADIPQEEEFSEEPVDYGMEKPEEEMEFNQTGPSEVSQTEEIINSIAGEIALLRNEIANLKNDFENFKSGKTPFGGDSTLGQEPKEEKSSGGFFADSNDDDTIALSGDELSNIFNTADFTEESVDFDTQQVDEDSDNGLPSMDFESEKLEEPVIEDNYFEEDESDDFPEEIDVPTGAESEENEIFEEIELDEEDQGTEEVFEDTQTTETDFQEDSFDVTEENTESIEEIFEEEVSDDFAEPALDSSDEILEEETVDTPDTVEEIAETVEEEISDEPVESVFESSQWDAPIDETVGFADEVTEEVSEGGVFADDPLIIEEPVDTITTAEEELLEELAEIPVEDDGLVIEPENLTVEAKTDIPDDLKHDIKSVLSYMDQLLDSLPEDKIAEFARSEHFELYKKLFTELGL